MIITPLANQLVETSSGVGGVQRKAAAHGCQPSSTPRSKDLVVVVDGSLIIG